MANEGILLIDKPEGLTSHDVVDQLRNITGIRTIGHAGTLDPFATGLLIVLIGRTYTKRQVEFLKLDKTYDATIHLGAETNTYDKTGTVLDVYNGLLPDETAIRTALKEFHGDLLQTPPLFSAKKIKGKKAYEYARKGEAINLAPQKITIQSINNIRYAPPLLSLTLSVSSGTYIRSFTFDLGRHLGCLGYLESLKRTTIGSFTLEKSHKLDTITTANWQRNLLRFKK